MLKVVTREEQLAGLNGLRAGGQQLYISAFWTPQRSSDRLPLTSTIAPDGRVSYIRFESRAGSLEPVEAVHDQLVLSDEQIAALYEAWRPEIEGWGE